MAKKGNAIKVRLESEAGTGYRYYAKRSARAEYKLRLKKYDPWALRDEGDSEDKKGKSGKSGKSGKNGAAPKRGKHVWFVEKKMPPSKKN